MADKQKTDQSKPKDIIFPDFVVDLAFHPEKDVICSGSIEGDVYLHSYSTSTDNSELMKLSHHKKSCRVLRFSEDGETLFTGSKDKSINVIDLNRGAVKSTFSDAHSCPLYSMVVTGENFIATGDDDGYLKLWDLRLQKAVMEVRESEEFISDIVTDNQRRMLLATSGEGTLTAFNLRRRKLELQSELFDSELLCLAIVKRGKKVVCGCGEGVVNIFNWGEWGNISDRYPGHPMSIDCMVPLTDDIIVTGSSDGKIRAVNILPNRFIGVVGDHSGDLPVENIALSRDKKYVASCSHDQKIKFWNVDSVEKELGNKNEKAKKSNRNKFLTSSQKGDFFSGLDDSKPSSSGANGNDDDDDDEWDTDDDDNSDDNPTNEINDNNEEVDDNSDNSDDDNQTHKTNDNDCSDDNDSSASEEENDDKT